MKAAPVMHALRERGAQQTLVHTGQHYDANMSDVFFTQLAMPVPDVNLEVGSGTHAAQTADIMARLEPVVLERKPDVVLVYGDVNSTVAAALVCSKLLVRIGHVEAGLRSFDRTMPEEINRLLTDQLADLLFTPSEDGDANLKREGIAPEKIHRVGNVMIDSLIRLLPAAQHTRNGTPERYALVTLHRPSNVDDGGRLRNILETLLEIQNRLGVIFPVHPRTRQRIAEFGIDVSWAADNRPASLHPVSGSTTARVSCDHRLGRDSGRNHLPACALLDSSQQYGASHHRCARNQCSGGQRHRQAQVGIVQSACRKRKGGQHSAALGRPRRGTYRGYPRESLAATRHVTFSRSGLCVDMRVPVRKS
jgi:hypothetical protein